MSMRRFFSDIEKNEFVLPAAAGGGGANKSPDSMATGGVDKKTPKKQHPTFKLITNELSLAAVSPAEQRVNQDFKQILARNADALEGLGLNTFFDMELLEQVYKELRSSQREQRTFDRTVVVSDNEQKVKDAIKFFFDAGGGDEPEPGGAGAMTGDEEKIEDEPLRNAA